MIVQLDAIDLDRFERGNEETKDLRERIGEVAKRHGALGAQRYTRGRTLIDIDEWESETHYFNFMAEAYELVAELAAARGHAPMDGVIWDRPF